MTGVKLPGILDSAARFGMTDPAVFLGIRATVGGLLCDQQAGLFGQGCLWPGDLIMTFGTGAFLLMNTGEQPVFSKEGLITTVAYQLAGRTTYALDGGIYPAGSAMTFLRDNIAFLTSPREAGTVAASAAPNGNLFFVPAFTGLGAPWQDPDARGMIIGIDGSTTKAQIVRAAEEAIAFQTADLTADMSRAANQPILRLRCDGGAAGDAAPPAAPAARNRAGIGPFGPAGDPGGAGRRRRDLVRSAHGAPAIACVAVSAGRVGGAVSGGMGILTQGKRAV